VRRYVEHCRRPRALGDRVDEPFLLVVEHRAGIDSRQFGEDVEGVANVGFLAIGGQVGFVG
jgi:hypothetical protein